ncbi:uncharacterized protein LOC142606074 [Castanea sativa]|uniref:uncharacterized protein LOC142606074 n=1 Tax=Castanea sativa TaxID=21020 RepID=UPI003F64DFBB
MNPFKCAFGVSSGKFLGFLVHSRGIDLDLAKATAIATMKPLATVKELKRFLGKVSYIRRFIPRLASITFAFEKLLKRGQNFEWGEVQQTAFKRLQQIMMNLPTMRAPIRRKPLLLYLAANQYVVGALITQEDGDGVEQPVYYISRALKDAETRYLRAEKACLENVYASQRLRHYFLAYEFPGEEEFSVDDEVLGEVAVTKEVGERWVMKFDGSSTTQSGGVGVILYYEENEAVVLSFTLGFPCLNSTTEYEAYLTELATALEMGVKHLRVIRDSNLMEVLMKGGELVELKVLKDYALVRGELYRRMTGGVLFRCVGQEEAQRKLKEVHDKTYGSCREISLYHRLQRAGFYWPSMGRDTDQIQVQCETCQLAADREESYVVFVDKDWRKPFTQYLAEGILPQKHSEQYKFRRLATRYFLHNGVLFKKDMMETHYAVWALRKQKV